MRVARCRRGDPAGQVRQRLRVLRVALGRSHPHRVDRVVVRRHHIPVRHRLPGFERNRVVRPHRRQEHDPLLAAHLRRQCLLCPHNQILQRRFVVAPPQQCVRAERPRLMLPPVQLIRARLAPRVVGHRHRRRPRAQQIRTHRVVREARQEPVLLRQPAPRDRQEVGFGRLSVLRIEGIEECGEQYLQELRTRDRLARPNPQPEPDGELPLGRRSRNPASRAAHRIGPGCPAHRQVHRRGPRQLQPFLQQLLHRRRAIAHGICRHSGPRCGLLKAVVDAWGTARSGSSIASRHLFPVCVISRADLDRLFRPFRSRCCALLPCKRWQGCRWRRRHVA